VPTIYKICGRAIWQDAQAGEHFAGSLDDRRDGFIHFSTVAQVAETASRHFARQSDLLLIAVEPDALAADLKWEPSRGGDLFPHLYAALPFSAVRWVRPLPDEVDGRRPFPELEP
jgi:uncharacterized protein (DUF952 family)